MLWQTEFILSVFFILKNPSQKFKIRIKYLSLIFPHYVSPAGTKHKWNNEIINKASPSLPYN